MLVVQKLLSRSSKYLLLPVVFSESLFLSCLLPIILFVSHHSSSSSHHSSSSFHYSFSSPITLSTIMLYFSFLFPITSHYSFLLLSSSITFHYFIVISFFY